MSRLSRLTTANGRRSGGPFIDKHTSTPLRALTEGWRGINLSWFGMLLSGLSFQFDSYNLISSALMRYLSACQIQRCKYQC